jgi:hypothetical protein
MLLREIQKDRDPIKEFLKGLNIMLTRCRERKYEIILMINANEEVGATPGGIGQIMADNGMYDILAMQHDSEKYPNTYIQGSQRIDYIFGSKRVLQYCKSSGMLPYCYRYPSDHRAIVI